jgi:hypothetical protein
MSKLKAKQRNKLPNSSFAGPDRSYPVFDKSHAANAKARASQMVKKGKLSSAAKARIDAKANKVLGKKKGMSHISPKRIENHAKRLRG